VAAVLAILKHPAYAGAFTYGRTRTLHVHFVNPSSVFCWTKGAIGGHAHVMSRPMSLPSHQERSHARAFCVSSEVNGR